MRIGESGNWIPLQKTEEFDPQFVAIRDREIALNPEGKGHLNAPVPSAHLWKASLPADLSPDSHLIEIKATDDYGNTHKGKRLVRVVE